MPILPVASIPTATVTTVSFIPSAVLSSLGRMFFNDARKLSMFWRSSSTGSKDWRFSSSGPNSPSDLPNTRSFELSDTSSSAECICQLGTKRRSEFANMRWLRTAPVSPGAVAAAVRLPRRRAHLGRGKAWRQVGLLSFMLRQKQKSQHAQHGEAERGFLAVPGRRLPHEEILSTDSLKPRQPQ